MRYLERTARWTLLCLLLVACRSPGEDSTPTRTPPVEGDETESTPTPDTAPPSPQDAAEDEERQEAAVDVSTLVQAVDPARYEDDLRFVAAPRPPGSAHWQAVQDRCAETFGSLGLDVERHDYGSGVNVLGLLRGTGRDDERIYVTAHYDHLEGCPGADDNATGVAGVLEAARVLSGERFDRTLVFACWDEEERGLLGAEAQAARARAAGETVAAMWSLEMIGYADDAPDSQTIPPGFDLFFGEQVDDVEAHDHRGDFIALASDEASRPATDRFQAWAEEVELRALPLELTSEQTGSPIFGDLRRSDHAAFWDQGYPGVMVTDTSNFRNPHYHCSGGPDVVDDLDIGFAVKVVRALVGATADLAGPRP
ncbi:MAG: M20/M25/M40 family metallo-hydrolase [Myxococcota bacterium]